jgi:hypothetical protein
MKEVFAITEKRKEGQEKPKHVLFGVNKNDLRNATRFTDARLKINWNDDFTWGLMCDDDTFVYILNHLMFGGFDPFEIPEAEEIYMKEMARKNIRFYKEVIMF